MLADMYKSILKTAIFAIACTAAVAASAAPHQARHDDHDAARSALRRGERKALASVVNDALRRFPGKLIEAEFDDGEYEIEILRDDGVVVELDYDARTGELKNVEHEDD